MSSFRRYHDQRLRYTLLTRPRALWRLCAQLLDALPGAAEDLRG